MACCGRGEEAPAEGDMEASSKEKPSEEAKPSEDEAAKGEEQKEEAPAASRMSIMPTPGAKIEHTDDDVDVDTFIQTWESHSYQEAPPHGRRLGGGAVEEPVPNNANSSGAMSMLHHGMKSLFGKKEEPAPAAHEEEEEKEVNDICRIDQLSIRAESESGKAMTEKVFAHATQTTSGIRTYGGPWVAGYPGEPWNPKGGGVPGVGKQNVLEAFAAVEAKSKLREDLLGAGLESQRADILGFWPRFGLTEVEEPPPPPLPNKASSSAHLDRRRSSRFQQ